MLGELKCLLGKHDWEYSKETDLDGLRSGSMCIKRVEHRICKRCGRHETRTHLAPFYTELRWSKYNPDGEDDETVLMSVVRLFTDTPLALIIGGLLALLIGFLAFYSTPMNTAMAIIVTTLVMLVLLRLSERWAWMSVAIMLPIWVSSPISLMDITILAAFIISVAVYMLGMMRMELGNREYTPIPAIIGAILMVSQWCAAEYSTFLITSIVMGIGIFVVIAVIVEYCESCWALVSFFSWLVAAFSLMSWDVYYGISLCVSEILATVVILSGKV